MSASLGVGVPSWSGVLVALESAPLAWRRRAPLVVLGATLGLGWVVAAVPATMVGGLVAALVAAYTVASRRRWAIAVAAGLVAAVASPMVVVTVLRSPFPFEFTVLPEPLHVANALAGAVVAFGGAVALGASVRVRRAYTASVEAYAARIERERAEQERRAVLEERTRIARELHDVAAHHLSGLVLQAGALERTVARDPNRAAALAREVREGGAQALSSMRRLVGLLRAADDEEAAIRGSRPTLADLDELVEAARADGLKVTFAADIGDARSSDRAPVGDEVELATYRVVQEALSNARRHAPGASVAVTLERDDDELVVEVVDDGGDGPRPPAADDEAGHGLIGMRERVDTLAGCFEAGPHEPFGWRVCARIPVTGSKERS